MASNNEGQLPDEYRFRIGDQVLIKGLKSKKDWNGKTAVVIGQYNKQKNRYPVELNINKKSQAYLKTSNIQVI